MISAKPCIPDVIDMFARYHRKNPEWGALHIVLADGNLSDDNVIYCFSSALDEGDFAGAYLASLLVRMSKTQRKKIAYLAAKETAPDA